MALFKRKKNDSVLPEVDEYYQAERRDRGWMAWLLALISVAVVVLAVIALFLGGRWVVDKIGGDDNTSQVVISDKDTVGSEDENLSFDGEANKPNVAEGSDEPVNTGSTDNNQGTVQAPVTTETPSTPSSGNTANTIPRTGDDTLPSTGPASLVGTFVGVTTLAGGIHYVINRRKISN